MGIARAFAIVRRLHGIAKKKYRPIADVAGCYGATAIQRRGGIGYETFVGLWLNIERTETRRAYGVLKGIGGAFGESLGQEWFAALYDSEEEAEAQFNRHQAHAAIDRMKDRNGQIADGGV